MNKNLIDYIIEPLEDKNINLNQLSSIKNFLKEFDLNTISNWYNFCIGSMEISISDTSIIMISLRIPSEETEDAIKALSKITQKICSIISLHDYKIHVNVLETRKINYDACNKLSFILNEDLKINTYGEETMVHFKNYKSITKIIDLYSTVLNTTG